jgi:hypothetical protein
VAAQDAEQIGPHLEQRIMAFSLGHRLPAAAHQCGAGAREVGRDPISEHGVWRILRCGGLNTRFRRLALIARRGEPYEHKPDLPPPERHIDATEPGGRSSSIALSAACWTPRAPSGNTPQRRRLRFHVGRVAPLRAQAALAAPRELVHRVAAELAGVGWKLREVTTDNGSELRGNASGAAVERVGGRPRFIRAGRPNSNGCANASS